MEGPHSNERICLGITLSGDAELQLGLQTNMHDNRQWDQICCICLLLLGLFLVCFRDGSRQSSQDCPWDESGLVPQPWERQGWIPQLDTQDWHPHGKGAPHAPLGFGLDNRGPPLHRWGKAKRFLQFGTQSWHSHGEDVSVSPLGELADAPTGSTRFVSY